MSPCSDMAFKIAVAFVFVVACRVSNTAAADVCIWCDPAMSDIFITCVYGGILGSKDFSWVYISALDDMKNSMMAASMAMKKSSDATKMKMMNGAMAGELAELAKSLSQSSSERADEISDNLMKIIGSCYVEASGKSDYGFTRELDNTVKFMMNYQAPTDGDYSVNQPDTAQSFEVANGPFSNNAPGPQNQPYGQDQGSPVYYPNTYLEPPARNQQTDGTPDETFAEVSIPLTLNPASINTINPTEQLNTWQNYDLGFNNQNPGAAAVISEYMDKSFNGNTNSQVYTPIPATQQESSLSQSSSFTEKNNWLNYELYRIPQSNAAASSVAAGSTADIFVPQQNYFYNNPSNNFQPNVATSNNPVTADGINKQPYFAPDSTNQNLQQPIEMPSVPPLNFPLQNIPTTYGGSIAVSSASSDAKSFNAQPVYNYPQPGDYYNPSFSNVALVDTTASLSTANADRNEPIIIDPKSPKFLQNDKKPSKPNTSINEPNTLPKGNEKKGKSPPNRNNYAIVKAIAFHKSLVTTLLKSSDFNELYKVLSSNGNSLSTTFDAIVGTLNSFGYRQYSVEIANSCLAILQTLPHNCPVVDFAKTMTKYITTAYYQKGLIGDNPKCQGKSFAAAFILKLQVLLSASGSQPETDSYQPTPSSVSSQANSDATASSESDYYQSSTYSQANSDATASSESDYYQTSTYSQANSDATASSESDYNQSSSNSEPSSKSDQSATNSDKSQWAHKFYITLLQRLQSSDYFRFIFNSEISIPVAKFLVLKLLINTLTPSYGDDVANDVAKECSKRISTIPPGTKTSDFINLIATCITDVFFFYDVISPNTSSWQAANIAIKINKWCKLNTNNGKKFPTVVSRASTSPVYVQDDPQTSDQFIQSPDYGNNQDSIQPNAEQVAASSDYSGNSPIPQRNKPVNDANSKTAKRGTKQRPNTDRSQSTANANSYAIANNYQEHNYGYSQSEDVTNQSNGEQVTAYSGSSGNSPIPQRKKPVNDANSKTRKRGTKQRFNTYQSQSTANANSYAIANDYQGENHDYYQKEDSIKQSETKYDTIDSGTVDNGNYVQNSPGKPKKLNKNDLESKERVNILMKYALLSISNGKFDYYLYSKIISALVKYMQENGADMSPSKIVLRVLIESLIACTQLLVQVPTQYLDSNRYNDADISGLNAISSITSYPTEQDKTKISSDTNGDPLTEGQTPDYQTQSQSKVGPSNRGLDLDGLSNWNSGNTGQAVIPQSGSLYLNPNQATGNWNGNNAGQTSPPINQNYPDVNQIGQSNSNSYTSEYTGADARYQEYNQGGQGNQGLSGWNNQGSLQNNKGSNGFNNQNTQQGYQAKTEFGNQVKL